MDVFADNDSIRAAVRALCGQRDAAARITHIVRRAILDNLDLDANAFLGELNKPTLSAALAELEAIGENGNLDAFYRFRALMILFGVYHQDPTNEGGTVYIRTQEAPDPTRAALFRRQANDAYALGVEQKLEETLRTGTRQSTGSPALQTLRIPDGIDTVVARTGLRIELDSCVGNDHVLVSRDIGARVVHASILLRDQETSAYDFPVRARVRRLPEPILRLSSPDKGVPPIDISTLDEVFDLKAEGPNQWIRLSKAAVIATGIVPNRLSRERDTRLVDLLSQLGGGLDIETGIRGVPIGSGTGTSSAIAAAIVAALVKMTGQTAETGPGMSDAEKMLVIARVLFVEQLIGALGGWQDPCAIFPGIKLLETQPGDFLPSWHPIRISDAARDDLPRCLKLTDGAYRQPSEAAAWQFAGLWAMRLQDVVRARANTRALVEQQLQNLQQGRIRDMGAIEHMDWHNRKTISPKATNPYVENVIARVRTRLGPDHAWFDACGARGGAGGCWWIDPDTVTDEAFAAAFLESSRAAMETFRDKIRFEGEPRIYDYKLNDVGLALEVR